jgi:hypothetical protein
MKMVSTRWAFFFLFCYALILGHNIIPHCHHSETEHLISDNQVEHNHDESVHGHDQTDFWSVLISVLSESEIHENAEHFSHLLFQDKEIKFSKEVNSHLSEINGLLTINSQPSINIDSQNQVEYYSS